MKELLILAAGVTPKEELVEIVRRSINEWDKSPTDENFNKIAFMASILGLRSSMPDEKDKIVNVLDKIKDIEELERMKKMTEPPSN